MSTYNYAAFSFALEAPELEGWRRDGIQLGQPAPDFQLADGHQRVLRLSDLRGRPVVLEFGSYTCPIFADRVPAMEALARRYPEARFLVVYIREAHPGEITGPHQTMAGKGEAAARLLRDEAIARTVLIDDLEGTVHRAYGGAWDPVYVIGSDGRVLLRRAWNDPRAVEQVLDQLRQGGDARPHESVEMVPLTGAQPMGLRLLQRGGLAALLDFYRSAPPRVQQALRSSPAPEVRAALEREAIAS